MTTPTFTYGGSDLPPKIQRAIARAMDPALPVELSSSERVALAALLRRVEAREGLDVFWVRRCNLADLFGKVERTVSNWLAALEEKGLIEKEQGRTRWGNFSCITLHLTQKACDLLGFAESLPGLNSKTNSNRKKISAGYKGCSTEGEQSLQRHQQVGSLPTESYPQGEVVVLPNGFKIPADCAPLIEIGVSPSGVFKLMKAAKLNGQRLGAIVSAKIDAIRASSRPFAYVLQLTRQRVEAPASDALPPAKKVVDPALKKMGEALRNLRAVLAGKFVKAPSGRVIKVGPTKDDLPQAYNLVDGRLVYAYALAGPRLVAFWDDMSRRYQDGCLEFFSPDLQPR